MNITRLNHFTAKTEKADALGRLLASAIPLIRASSGCVSCELIQSQPTPTRFVVLETWDRAESHQQALKSIPPSAFAGIMELLDGAPSGEYFTAFPSSH